MDKKTPKKVFILQNGKYIEITFSEYCRRAKIDDTYKSMLFLPLHGMLMEVTPMTYEEFYRGERRQKYLREQSIENDDFSYHSLTTDEFNGEDILIDGDVSVCEKAIENIMIEKLRTVIPLLTNEEIELLNAIFYRGLSEREWSRIVGIPQKTIHYRKWCILRKLRKLIEK